VDDAYLQQWFRFSPVSFPAEVNQEDVEAPVRVAEP
jgi:hypothetical protein